METASAVMDGVAWELLFFVRAFFLGFCLRMGYDGLLLLRLLLRHRHIVISLEDFIFWMTGSVLMFGLLFQENNGTPRLFALAGVLAGMLLYHLGPSPLICGLFDRILRLIRRKRKIIGKNVKEALKKMRNQFRMKTRKEHKE